MLSCQKTALEILSQYWFAYDKPVDWLLPKNNVINRSRLILFIFPGISTNTKDGLDGLNVLPAIPSAMLLALTFMKMVQTF